MNSSIPGGPALRRVVCTAIVIVCASVSQAQAQPTFFEDSSWTESVVAPPENFSTEILQSFDVGIPSSLSYGIDPASLQVGDDGVVRFVMVARSSNGALNVFFQGIRCSTGQTKTYARLNTRRAWNIALDAPWQSLSFSGPTRPAMMLARQGVCDGRTTTGSPQKILTTLKTDRTILR